MMPANLDTVPWIPLLVLAVFAVAAGGALFLRRRHPLARERTPGFGWWVAGGLLGLSTAAAADRLAWPVMAAAMLASVLCIGRGARMDRRSGRSTR